MTFRKSVAQLGVLLYLSSMIVPIASLPALLLLILAAIMPSKAGEVFGSMWPLVGYDNAIDAIYVRGPWAIRFQEMDEMDVQRDIALGMKSIFG